MYFKLFKPQNWRKRSGEARRRNCAVLPLFKRFGGLDRLHLGAVGSEGLRDLIVVEAEGRAGLSVDGSGAVIERHDGHFGGVLAVHQDVSDHVGGLDAEVRVVDAVAEERAVQGEGVRAGVLRDAGLSEHFVDGKLGGHDGVVGRGEDGVDAVGHGGLSREDDLVNGRAGVFLIADALRIEVGLRIGDRGRGGVLADVVEQTDVGGVGVRGEDEVQDGAGVERVGRAGDVGASNVTPFCSPMAASCVWMFSTIWLRDASST